jgi:hypothetical protein
MNRIAPSIEYLLTNNLIPNYKTLSKDGQISHPSQSQLHYLGLRP